MTKFAETITNEELQKLSTAGFPGQVTIVDKSQAIAEACDYLMSQPIIGFDTESRPSFKPGKVNKLALLQLSSADRCFLFRLNNIRLEKEIVKVLETSDIVKVGAAVHDDLKALRALRPFRPQSFVDLQSIIGNYGIKELSLRKMAGIVMSLRLSKAQRLSNWEASELTEAQKQYAATDAWISLEIYRKLNCF